MPFSVTPSARVNIDTHRFRDKPSNMEQEPTPEPPNLDLPDDPPGKKKRLALRVQLDEASYKVLVDTMEKTGRSASSVVRGCFLTTKPGERPLDPGARYSVNVYVNHGMTAGRVRHALCSAERIAPDTKARKRQFTVYCPRGWLPAARRTGKKLTDLVMEVLKDPPPAFLEPLGPFFGRLNVTMHEWEERRARQEANALGLSLPQYVGRRLAHAGDPK